MAIKIQGSSGNTADVNSAGEVKVTLSSTEANMGGVRMFSENDPGDVTGSPMLRSPETSQDYRLRVGVDTVLFYDTFNATTQNTGNWKCAFTTMTMTQSAGFLNVNAAGTSTVSGNYAYLQSWRYFPIIGTAPLSVEFTGQITAFPTANEVFLAGLGVAVAAAEPVDGCWFELTSAGLNGVLRYNSGVAQKVTLIATVGSMPLNTNAKYAMVVSERSIDFWIDDVLYGSLDIPDAQGQPFLTTALPLFVTKYNSNTVGSSPNMIIKVGNIVCSLTDLATSKPWSEQMTGMGSAYQGQNGHTQGNNTTFVNNTQPTTALPVNTALTANLPALLGGVGLATMWNLAATDMVLMQYQNPAGSVNITPRTLYIRGVTIGAVTATAAWTAPAAGGHALLFALCTGHTATSLATAETGSFVTATTKQARRKPLGFLGTATTAPAIGTDLGKIQVKWDCPVVVNPGGFVTISCRMMNGAATATGGMYFVVDFDYYWE
jgi:hypothetical protein